MAGDDLYDKLFGTRTRRETFVPDVEAPDDGNGASRTDAATADATATEPLLAPADIPAEHWRGYVLVCVNANVERVCESVKERLGGHFRGMSLVTGLYDLIVRVEAASKEEFKQTLILVRETPGVVQSVTLMDLN